LLPRQQCLTMKNAIFTPIYSAHIQKIPWYTYIMAIFPGVIFTIVISILAWLTANCITINNWGLFIVIGSLLGVVSIALIFIFGLKSEDKHFLRGYIPWLKNE